MQAITYYFDNISDARDMTAYCELPCFVVTIFGTFLVVCGAIFNGDNILVDESTVISLLFQPNDKASMINAVKALKVAVKPSLSPQVKNNRSKF